MAGLSTDEQFAENMREANGVDDEQESPLDATRYDPKFDPKKQVDGPVTRQTFVNLLDPGKGPPGGARFSYTSIIAYADDLEKSLEPLRKAKDEAAQIDLRTGLFKGGQLYNDAGAALARTYYDNFDKMVLELEDYVRRVRDVGKRYKDVTAKSETIASELTKAVDDLITDLNATDGEPKDPLGTL